jgi:hypothetical protein
VFRTDPAFLPVPPLLQLNLYPRSGNPGYLPNKPILAGDAEFYNEVSLLLCE